jgi:uncharacterized membrane protein YagU involved in acid resistance
MQQPTLSAKRTILKAWLIAGSLDIITACLYFRFRTGKDPLRVLHFVASGVFDKAALSGGSLYAVYGLLLHYLIAFLFTVFFFWVYPKFRWLAYNRWITALVYGSFVWSVMNLLIVPLSHTPTSPFQPGQAIIAAIILVVMVGLPLSVIIGRYYTSRKTV